MPELKLLTNDGGLTDDAFAVAFSTMHFPSPEDEHKRALLANAYRREQLTRDMAPEDEDGEPSYTLTRSDIEILCGARDLRELVPDIGRQYRDGFIAGHWLAYRIFADHTQSVRNSTNGWEDYAASYLMPKLPRIAEWEWPIDGGVLRSIATRFGPVAHLWAAATYDEKFRRAVFLESKIRPPKLSWAHIFPGSRKRFIQEAQGFLVAGIEAKAFSSKNAKLTLGQVWTLPEAIAPIMPVVEHPDHLLEVEDFNEIRERYIPHSEATKFTRADQAAAVNATFRTPEVNAPAGERR